MFCLPTYLIMLSCYFTSLWLFAYPFNWIMIFFFPFYCFDLFPSIQWLHDFFVFPFHCFMIFSHSLYYMLYDCIAIQSLYDFFVLPFHGFMILLLLHSTALWFLLSFHCNDLRFCCLCYPLFYDFVVFNSTALWFCCLCIPVFYGFFLSFQSTVSWFLCPTISCDFFA